MGRFGNLSDDDKRVVRCGGCGAAWLEGVADDLAGFYETNAYREEVDGSADTEKYFALHDVEQIRNLSVVGTGSLRGRTIADVGCGAGSFLDSVRGVAGECVAVEPSAAFRETLVARGYATYPYAAEAAREKAGSVDLAVSFSVIEHIEDPLVFLRDIRNLLRKGGTLVVSTPNTDDVLLEALPDSYPAFYFRKAHIWYFNHASLAGLLEAAGFGDVEIVPHQRFGLSNFLGWLKEKRPTGNASRGYVTPAMDAAWRSELERTMRCDYLFATAVNKG